MTEYYIVPTSYGEDFLAQSLGVPHVSAHGKLPKRAKCHYCGTHATTRDHVVPQAKFGVNRWWNLVPSCASCNNRKGAAVGSCTCEFCYRARFFMSQHNAEM